MSNIKGIVYKQHHPGTQPNPDTEKRPELVVIHSAYADEPELIIWQTDNQAKSHWCYVGTVDDYKKSVVATSQYKDELAYGAQVILNGDLLKHRDAMKILYDEGYTAYEQQVNKELKSDDLPF